MRMRTYHGALLLVLAMVMAMLSTGICTGTAPVPVPAPAPTANSLGYPPIVHNCWKILSNNGCDQKACNGNCFIKLKGTGVCVHGSDRAECLCYYLCKSPPPLAW